MRCLSCLKQLLREETEASEAKWDELNQTVSSLREIISPAAATLLTEQLDGRRDRWGRHLHVSIWATATHTVCYTESLLSSSWAVVSGTLDQQLQRSGGILQVWEVYAGLAASLTKWLQMLQSDVTSALSGTSVNDNTVEQVTVKIHKAQVGKWTEKQNHSEGDM